MPTMNSWNNQVLNANVTFNGGSMNIGSDATDNAINIGTNANAGRTVTIGNIIGATAVNVNTGTSGTVYTCTNGVFTLHTGTGQISLGNDAVQKAIVIGNGTGNTSVTVDCGTNGASFGATANAHTTTIGSTNGAAATTVQSGSGALNVTSANGAMTINSGTGVLAISNDAAITTVELATGGAVKTLTVGSNNGASQTTVQSGTNGLAVNSNGGGLVINSGVGALSISNDASATTVNIASGGAAKVVQLGSTNGASSLALRYGTADFTLASATGTTMSVLDTGEMTMPLQSAFLAYLSASDANVTGDGTGYILGSGNAMTEIFDQNADFNVNGTFTAPVTGRFVFYVNIRMEQLAVTHTRCFSYIITSNGALTYNDSNPWPVTTSTVLELNASGFFDMDAGDTSTTQLTVSGGAKVVDIIGADRSIGVFGGYLVC